MKRSGNPSMMMKNPSEMENQVYSKANSKVSEDVIIDVSHSTTDLNSSVYCIYVIMYVRFVLHCGVRNIDRNVSAFDTAANLTLDAS